MFPSRPASAADPACVHVDLDAAEWALVRSLRDVAPSTVRERAREVVGQLLAFVGSPGCTVQQAILEHVSCIDFLETGNNFVRMEMRYTLGGVAQRHQFVHTRVGTSLIGSIDVWSFSQPVRLYADAGTILQMAALRRSTTGSGGIECQISGHYVDAP